MHKTARNKPIARYAFDAAREPGLVSGSRTYSRRKILMAEQAKIVTGIGKAELHRILVRGYDLNKELVGKITFTDMTSLILRGRLPTPNEAKMLDALLVILVENGMVSHVVA